MIEYYFIVYTIIVLLYIFYRYMVLYCFLEPSFKGNSLTTSVVIPTYNEQETLLKRCLLSCIKAGADEVIIVDDGSKNEYKSILSLIKCFKIKYYKFPQNRGKRYAQSIGFKLARSDIIVTVDSDTILSKDALEEIKKPFNEPKIGAVTGYVKALNRNENLLTKIISSRYDSAFLLERSSQSKLGIVSCCCGSFSAYRADFVKKNITKYLAQTFLGKKCNFGDDRYLTNLCLEAGYEVVFRKQAIAYTQVPTTLKCFIKQQLRWTQSFIREGLFTMRYMFKRSSALSFETIITYSLPLLSFLVRTSMVVFLVIYPYTIIYYIIMVLVMALFRNVVLFVEGNSKNVFYSVLYGFLHTGIIYWLYYPALLLTFTRNRKWSTR